MRFIFLILAGLLSLAVPAVASAQDYSILTIANQCPGMVVWAEIDGREVTTKLRMNQKYVYKVRASNKMTFLYASEETPNEVLASKGPLNVDPDDCETRASLNGYHPGTCNLIVSRDGVHGFCF